MATLGLALVAGRPYRSPTVSTPKVEAFHWAISTFSQTLGTALGGWLACTRQFGYERGALALTTAAWISAAHWPLPVIAAIMVKVATIRTPSSADPDNGP